MKKLMIAAVAVAMAACSQAATFNWTSGTMYKAVDANGTFGTGRDNTLSNYANIQWFVFEGISAQDLADAATAGTVYGWLTEGPSQGTKLSPSDGQGTVKNGTMNPITSAKYAGGDTVNWASVIVYTDPDDKVWYVENYGTDKFDSLGSEITKGDLGNLNATTGATITSWTAAQAAPEPTSGLLLLLGVAGLALKRKRA